MPEVCLLVATRFEYWALRGLPAVEYAGIGLNRWSGAGQSLIVAGLGGALIDLPPGTLVIPESVETTDGRPLECDPLLRESLLRAADERGYAVETGPMLTAGEIITGPGRAEWAERGFVAVDMETGLLASRAQRVAAARVILDTPRHEISRDWLGPGALMQPRLWAEAGRLALRAPLYMRRLAHVLQIAMRDLA